MNIEAVLGTCERLPDTGITHRRTAVSTIGWIPASSGSRPLAPGPPCALAARRRRRPALADHARQRALPAGRGPRGVRALHASKRRQVFVEYVMLAGVNDRYEQAVALAELLDPRVYKVNLIPYNPTDAPYEGSGAAAIAAFKAALEERGVRATIRLTRGVTSTPPAGSWQPARPPSASSRRRPVCAARRRASTGRRTPRPAPGRRGRRASRRGGRARTARPASSPRRSGSSIIVCGT